MVRKHRPDRLPEKRGQSTKVLRNRDEGNFSNMGSTATKMKVKMLAIWNLVRACLRDASGKYNDETEKGAVALEEANEIASQASHRKPKQLRQQTKDKKEKKESSSEGSTSDSDGTNSNSDICSWMFRWRLRRCRPPELSAPLLPSPPPFKDEGDKKGKRSTDDILICGSSNVEVEEVFGTLTKQLEQWSLVIIPEKFQKTEINPI